jgi:hypothetical protein
MEGISDRGSSGCSRSAARKRSRLVARRGSLRNGGRRAGRPVTRCQRLRTRPADSAENAERCDRACGPKRVRAVKARDPSGSRGDSKGPIITAKVGCWSLKMWIARRLSDASWPYCRPRGVPARPSSKLGRGICDESRGPGPGEAGARVPPGYPARGSSDFRISRRFCKTPKRSAQRLARF